MLRLLIGGPRRWPAIPLKARGSAAGARPAAFRLALRTASDGAHQRIPPSQDLLAICSGAPARRDLIRRRATSAPCIAIAAPIIASLAPGASALSHPAPPPGARPVVASGVRPGAGAANPLALAAPPRPPHPPGRRATRRGLEVRRVRAHRACVRLSVVSAASCVSARWSVDARIEAE